MNVSTCLEIIHNFLTETLVCETGNKLEWFILANPVKLVHSNAEYLTCKNPGVTFCEQK